MTDASEISFANVLDLCRQREVRLAYEIGAFVVLEACEAVVAQPRAISAHDVRLSPDGSTRVAAGRAADLPDAAAALAELLAAVLVVARQEVPAMLMHLVDVSQARELGLAGYRDELEATLVPLNRAAARRVLARQLRELTRAMPGARAGEVAGAGPHDARVADADLDALLGYDGFSPGGESLVSPESGRSVDDAVRPERFREPTASAALSGPGPVPAPLGLPSTEGLDGRAEGATRGSSGRLLLLGLLIVVAIGVGAYVWLSSQT